MTDRFSRRDLLQLGAVVIVGTALPATLRRALQTLRPRDDVVAGIGRYVDRLSLLSDDERSMRILGRRSHHRLETDPNAVLRALEQIYGKPTELHAADDDRLRQQLTAAARRDFRAQRTAIVDGWVLSRSEAVVATAFSLLR